MTKITKMVRGVVSRIVGAGDPADRAEAEALLAHLETFQPPSAAATPTYARRPTGRKATRKKESKK